MQKTVDDQQGEIEQLRIKYIEAQKRLSKKSSSSKPKKFRAVNYEATSEQQEAYETSLANEAEEESAEIGSRKPSNSHQFLKELKDKQRKGEQRVTN